MVIRSAIRVLFEILIGTHEKVEFEVEKIVHATIYRILLIIHNENFLLFHTSLPSFLKKRSQLPAFTSFHSIHMQKFAKKLLRLQSNPRKTRKFFTTNDKQYTV